MDLLFLKNITKRYAQHTAVDDITLSIPEQSIFGLLGPNGAGKTSLIRIINQITAPDSGEVFFKGEKLQLMHTEEIGYLPEERGLYKKMEVGEQVLYLAQLKGLSKKESFKRLKYWFEKFEMQSWWNKKIEELSKGMQQKVQFIVTIIHEPKLLILDEPFTGFDPINTNLITQELLDLQAKGTTIILSTHRMESVEELCSHIALINRAKKILDGSVKDIRKAYKSRTYEVEYSGGNSTLAASLAENFEVLSSKEESDNHKSIIKILHDQTTNDLLNVIIAHAEVHSFKEIIPSMNDIFISKVKESITQINSYA